MSDNKVEYTIEDIRMIEDKARQMRGEALRYGIAWIAARLWSAPNSAKTMGGLAAS